MRSMTSFAWAFLQAKELLKGPNGVANFEKKYGRNFIYGSVSGGWYHAVYSFDATTASQRTEIKTKVAGSFKTAMVTGKASAEFTNTATVRVLHHRKSLCFQPTVLPATTAMSWQIAAWPLSDIA